MKKSYVNILHIGEGFCFKTFQILGPCIFSFFFVEKIKLL
jgi:hypothetical protein